MQEGRVVNGNHPSAGSPTAATVTSPINREDRWQEVVPAVSSSEFLLGTLCLFVVYLWSFT